MQYFGRKYQLSILTARNLAITFDPLLKITGTIVEQIIQGFQYSEITIYNLDADTETDILKNGTRISLEAGYKDGAYGLIFSGSIVQAIRGKEDATTYYLRLVVIDGDGPLNLGLASLSTAAGTSVRELASLVARSSSIPFDIRIDAGIGEQKLSRGASYQGRPGKILRQIAKDNGANFYFSKGQAIIAKQNKPPSGVIPFLNSQSGLVDFPTQTDQGIKFRTLINPQLTLGDWVKLNNKDIIVQQLELGVPQTLLDQDGIYRIIGMTTTFDNRGNNWYQDCECVSQTGSVIGMLSDASQQG
jgi:baseplate hub protein gp41